jgi:FAD:protein FMN transferase
MDNRKKNIIYSALLIISVFAVWLYRKGQTEPLIAVDGTTMGTTYHITYFDSQKRDFKNSIDSILRVFNDCLSTYRENSEISTFNTKQRSFKFKLPYFYPSLKRSQEIVAASQGAFDPTVGPLANVWGFGEANPSAPDSAAIDSIMTFVGFEKIQFNTDSVWKYDSRITLNFNAIAKGYGVDVVADYLKSNGISNALVEIGGEVVAIGKNLQSGKSWQLGILDPESTPDNHLFKAYLLLTDKALATSGNYFNYREIDGRKVSHTLNPETGYPVQRNILSASVVARDCMTADAWATAFMVMGYDKGIEIVKKQQDIDVFFIYSLPDGSIATYTSPGLTSMLTLK